MVLSRDNFWVRVVMAALRMAGLVVAPAYAERGVEGETGAAAAVVQDCCEGEIGATAEAPSGPEGCCKEPCGKCVPTGQVGVRGVVAAPVEGALGVLPQLSQLAVASHVGWTPLSVELDAIFHPPRA